jgi:hypothetical protein
MNNDIQLKLDVARKTGLVFSELPWSTVRIGERLAGTILDEASGVIYDLMLIPGEMDEVTWDKAKAIALATGGDLPTREEMAILHANLELQFGEKTYWTNEVVQFEGITGESCSYFSFDLGDCFDFTNKDDSMWALGVRRVPGGDAADLPPEQRPRNVVPAPAIPAKAGMSAGADAAAGAAQKWAELSAAAPKVPVDDIATALAQLRMISASHPSESLISQGCRNACTIIEGLLPHAGAGVLA